MDTRWLAQIDSHISAGQVAAEAESAELLSWLLKLEPEQRWCLTLNRDKRLERLSASDYRRLLALMVEHAAQALAEAPLPPRPCLEDLPALPVPVDGTAERSQRQLRPRRVILWATLAGFATLGAQWLITQDGAQRLLDLGHRIASLPRSLAGEQRHLAAIDERLDQEHQATERLLGLMTARGALETLERRFATGDPFTHELAALERVWPTPDQLAPLQALAATGGPTPERLRGDLERLHQGLTTRHESLTIEARSGRISRDQYYARLQSLSTLRTQGEAALAAVRRGDWTEALQVMRTLDDPDYRAWQTKASAWLEAQTRVSDLSRQIWSQWLQALPPTPVVDSP